MTLYILDTITILVIVAAIAGYINYKYLKLPFAIALMLAGLIGSLVILGIDSVIPNLGLGSSIRTLMANVDFEEALLHGMLSFLLFAGALHIELEALLKKKWPILTLASFGLLISTVLIGFGSYYILLWIGTPVPISFCLLFGALISPTDPIAVLGIMKTAGATKSLEIKVSGESLFNDGFGVVVFTLFLIIATGSGHAPGDSIQITSIVAVFLQEVLGGVLLGFFAGMLVFLAMRRLDEPNLEVLLTLALVLSINFIANQLHTSGPLACVVAGLLIGNRGRKLAMSERTKASLDLVWSFIDETLNAVLFLLIGLEVVVMNFDASPIFALAAFIVLSLAARFVSVYASVLLLRLRHEFSRGAVRILTWGGLKGGISIALALSLPNFEGRDLILTGTYAIVVFSILVQGLTVGLLIRKVAMQPVDER